MIPAAPPHSWEPGPATVQIGRDEVHLWRIALGRLPAELAALAQTLSPDERERAGRFYFERDRSAFLVARGALRALLARYLGQAPAELRFSYGPQGKPKLAHRGLSFNLAHSGALALLAVGDGAAIGVDLELIPPLFPGEAVARHFFSSDELQVLLATPARHRHRAFFTYWTRKEAFIKAVGGGLSIPLDAFDVDWPGLEGPSVRFRGLDAPGPWSLADLAPAPGYAAAVASNSRWRLLSCWSGP